MPAGWTHSIIWTLNHIQRDSLVFICKYKDLSLLQVKAENSRGICPVSDLSLLAWESSTLLLDQQAPFSQTVLFIYFYIARYLPIHLTTLTKSKLHKHVEHKDSIMLWVHIMLQLIFISHCLYHHSAIKAKQNSAILLLPWKTHKFFLSPLLGRTDDMGLKTP